MRKLIGVAVLLALQACEYEEHCFRKEVRCFAPENVQVTCAAINCPEAQIVCAANSEQDVFIIAPDGCEASCWVNDQYRADRCEIAK